MDRFLIATNPLQPESPKYIIDTVTNIWFMISEDEKSGLSHIHGGSPEVIKHSKNRAERWYNTVKEKEK